jgi:hypothetical protein
LEKTREVPEHFPSWQPQQLSFHLPKPKHSQDESYSNNLHFKKNLVKIGRAYQKLLTFGGLKTILPHCGMDGPGKIFTAPSFFTISGPII